MTEANLPAGWTEERIGEVLRHYEGQSEDDAVLEDENSSEVVAASRVVAPLSQGHNWFLSYVHADNEDDQQGITRLCSLLSAELSLQAGEKRTLWMDKTSID